MALIITWGAGELGLLRIAVDGLDDDNNGPSFGAATEIPSSRGADDGRSRGRAAAAGRGLVFGMLHFGALSNDDGDDEGAEIFSDSAKGTNDDDDGEPLGAAKGSHGADDGTTECTHLSMARGGLLGRLGRADAGSGTSRCGGEETVGMPWGANVSSWSLGTAEGLMLRLLAAAAG
jgi:hypothetical protein